MTSPNERSIAASRGKEKAASVIQSRLDAIGRLGISYQADDEFSITVESLYTWHLVGDVWRAIDDADDWGFTLPKLVQALKRRKQQQESSAEAGAVITTGSVDPDARAEASAGELTASRLPEVVL